MRRGPRGGKVGVEAVRQRGGDCLESVRQRVQVVREDERMETGEEILQYNQKEQQDRQKLQDLRVVAEIRGEKAQRRLEQEKWLEEKMMREEMERKESVRLIEMLRSARILNEAPAKSSTSASASASAKDTESLPGSSSVATSSSGASMTDSIVKITRVKPTVTFSESSKATSTQARPSEPVVPRFPEHKERQFVKLGSGIKPLDDTEEVSSVSALSTILEESERVVSQSLPDIQNSDTELTTFPLSSITTNRDGKRQEPSQLPPSRLPPQNINLSDVRRIVERVKKQGERLPLSETHFQTIAGNGTGSATKVDSGGAGAEKEKYAVNQEFIKKVLDFSSSSQVSSISSDESSAFLSLQKSLHRSKANKTKANSVTRSKLPPSDTLNKPTFSPILKPQNLSQSSDDSTRRLSPQSVGSNRENSKFQSELRRYIVKLLQMKQEEIENLSVSSTVIDSSSTDQDLRIDCDKILELYQSTRSNLQSKLSKSELPRKN